ncbi:gamma-glutamylcyclotransferase [Salinivibrio proteolyticus]|uniref:gamma-glutamylcyclotransferase family protein n=1 Tax=Salinivibrio proteolyticus TaxID=334715 RepID=UPI0009899C3A|nr:gamma-glutamylcyclotransferase family protein [Salinivibrio proteolyticus]OOF26454.1 gamma-glutamylcyclotransferase [Salinivibrio proteolyticus]
MYLFGYGSLMNPASRALTGESGWACPVTVSGLQRYWSNVSEALISPLVVLEGDGACNGVLVKIAPDALPDFDRREAGYRRLSLDASRIALPKGIALEGPVYVYVAEDRVAPDVHKPIAQSYIDTVMAGCLRYSSDFAAEFLHTTQGWDAAYCNDRAQPRYPRVAGVSDEDWVMIDDLMKTHLGQHPAEAV